MYKHGTVKMFNSLKWSLQDSLTFNFDIILTADFCKVKIRLSLFVEPHRMMILYEDL